MNEYLPILEATYAAPKHRVRRSSTVTRAILVAWFFAFIFSLALLANISVGAPAAPATAPAVAENRVDAFYVIKVNELRAKNNLAPVRLLIELNDSSTNKANNMAANHYWGHEDPDGTQFSDYIWKKVPAAQYVGENLARCYQTRDAAFAALVASPTHYQIMVGNFNYMGVSEAYDVTTGCTITAMHFARI